MYKTLLFATDLLEGSHHASLHAKEIADKFEATLYIMHVVELPITEQYAQALGFAETISPPVDDAILVVKTLADELGIAEEKQIVVPGRASYMIIEKAKEIHADAIIIGSHSESTFPHFLGSTANSIVHKAHCDVITLRKDKSHQP